MRAEAEAREVGELWRCINRAAHAGMRNAFRGSALTPGAMFVLGQVKREPGVTINEIARRSGIAKSHVSNTVNTLARELYVEKLPDEEDARLVRVHLAPAAKELMDELDKRSHDAWRGAIARLEDEERAQVLAGLRLLLRAVESNGRNQEEDPAC